MIKKFIALAALSVSSLAAVAAPTTLAAWENNAYIQSHGMAGVQFVSSPVSANGEWVALGAHPYRDGVLMPNDGNTTYFGAAGLSTKADPGQSRANWSFDFAWSCSGCTVALTITDNNNAANTVTLSPLTMTDIDAGNGTWLESWNLEMAFLQTLFTFDPNGPSSTNFTLVMSGATGAPLARTSINVDVLAVPEPASLALTGLALGALAFARRRKA